MRIPEAIVSQIQQTADITDVVGDYVTLKRRGANLMACCPFHEEKTPSFNVNPARGIFKCFGCGKAGDSVRFVMEIEGITFPEALRHLAKKYGIDIPETQQTPEDIAAQNEKDSLYIALDFARKFYQQQLSSTPEGQAIGLSYFRERGFSQPIMDAFELGYASESWDALSQAAIKNQFQAEVLEKAGLCTIKENRFYDRFRARVMFPIHGLSGKVIGFGGRILKSDKTQAKYINSPESAVYHKSQTLYGLFQGKNSIREQNNALLVEGYTDVLSLHQAGIRHTVSSSGTSLTVEQIRLLKRFTPNITVLYDGDAAGVKAALRGMDLLLEEGLNVKLCTFPDNDDPDSFLRKVGSEGFKTFIHENAKDFITFKVSLLLKEANDDPFLRAGVIKEMVESIVKIPDAITKQVFFRQTARLMNIPEETLISEANRRVNQERKNQPKDRPPVPPPSQQVPEDFPSPEEEWHGETPPTEVPENKTITALERAEEAFCRLAVLYGTEVIETEYRDDTPHAITVMEELAANTFDVTFSTPLYQTFVGIFRAAYEQENYPDTDFFLHNSDEAIKAKTIDFVSDAHPLSDNWRAMHQIYIPTEKDSLAAVVHEIVLKLKKAFNDTRLQTVEAALKSATTPEEQDALLGDFVAMKRIDLLLAKELGITVGR